MKVVMVTGIEETDKNTIIDLAMSRSRKLLPNFSRVDFETGVKVVEENIEESLEVVRDELSEIYAGFEKDVIGKMKSDGGHIILNTQLAAKTMHGYVPLVPAEFFKTFKPDVIILMEADPKDVAKTEEEAREIRERQEINRHYATVYSMSFGSVLKIIRLKKGNVTGAVSELLETMKIIL